MTRLPRPPAWVVACALSFVLGIAWHLPARLAFGWLSVPVATTPDGSIARWSVRAADGASVRFVVDPSVLLSARYGGSIEVERGPTRLSGRVVRSWNGAIELADGVLVAELAPFVGALGLPRSMLDGRLALHDVAATLRGGAITALACRGEVTGVRGGGGTAAIAIGDLGVQCASEDGGPTVRIEDRGGPLAFEATIRLTPDGRYLLEGSATARDGAPPALAAALPLFGRSSGPATVSFRYAGSLPDR